MSEHILRTHSQVQDRRKQTNKLNVLDLLSEFPRRHVESVP